MFIGIDVTDSKPLQQQNIERTQRIQPIVFVADCLLAVAATTLTTCKVSTRTSDMVRCATRDTRRRVSARVVYSHVKQRCERAGDLASYGARAPWISGSVFEINGRVPRRSQMRITHKPPRYTQMRARRRIQRRTWTCVPVMPREQDRLRHATPRVAW